ncbi:MAG TPA: ribbon-helix-helix protein, CopG family [Vicinamibacterales bacterium]|nr:ribbon-helix-helix protein, CopG family [Vicinamibacterales bacterium]
MTPHKPGRPARARDGASRLDIKIRLSAEERAALRDAAAELGVPMSAMVRDAVNEFVADFSERRVFESPSFVGH